MGIKWKDSLAIGVEIVDGQHKELIHRFDVLQEAGASGKELKVIYELLAFLEEYVRTHFEDEEGLQILHNYPAFEAHRSEHLYFIEQLDKLKTDLASSGISPQIFSETSNVLTKWLVNHICNIDMEFGSYLKSKKNDNWLLKGKVSV